MADSILQRMYDHGEQHIAKYGDVGCGSHAWLAANKDTATFADYLKMISANTDWGPGVCMQMFTLGGLYFSGEALAALQKTYAAVLAQYPFDKARGRIERVLLTVFPLDPEVSELLIGAIIKHHPDASAFLKQIGA